MIDIDELERLINAHKMPGSPISGATALALIAEVRALREDAERYAFLKRQARSDPKMDGQHVWYSIPMRNPNGGALRGNTLDDAIDAAQGAK
jgi:hypothetical protein